jgi:hypothetical protein
MLVFFTQNQFVALGGFILMVVSVGWIVTVMRRRSGGSANAVGGWVDGLRQRWRRGR